jgi:Hemolysin coregulated protein Hcp (TssD)
MRPSASEKHSIFNKKITSMDKVLLFISGNKSGSLDSDGYEVLSYNFSTEREFDKKGLVSSALKAMLLEVEIYSTKGKAIAIGFMFNMYEQVKGKIEFYTNDPGSGASTKYKTIKFEDGHIVSYSEHFEASSHRSMTEIFTISAGKIDSEAGSYSHEWRGK